MNFSHIPFLHGRSSAPLLCSFASDAVPLPALEKKVCHLAHVVEDMSVQCMGCSLLRVLPHVNRQVSTTSPVVLHVHLRVQPLARPITSSTALPTTLPSAGPTTRPNVRTARSNARRTARRTARQNRPRKETPNNNTEPRKGTHRLQQCAASSGSFLLHLQT